MFSLSPNKFFKNSSQTMRSFLQGNNIYFELWLITQRINGCWTKYILVKMMSCSYFSVQYSCKYQFMSLEFGQKTSETFFQLFRKTDDRNSVRENTLSALFGSLSSCKVSSGCIKDISNEAQ